MSRSAREHPHHSAHASPTPVAAETSWPPKDTTTTATPSAPSDEPSDGDCTSADGTAGSIEVGPSDPFAEVSTAIIACGTIGDPIFNMSSEHSRFVPKNLREHPLVNYDEDAQAGSEISVKAPKTSSKSKFAGEAWRALMACEAAMAEQLVPTEGATQALADIRSLKERYGPPADGTKRLTGPYKSRKPCSTRSGHRRFSLDADARWVLRGWINDHLDDPYPTVPEKQFLAEQAKLSVKQVNDYFTNYRKRHWEDELLVAGKTPHPAF